MIDTHFILFIMNDLLFASLEKKAIIKKLQENSKRGLDRNTLIFELEMEKIYHKIDLNREINSMIKSSELKSEEISVQDGSIIEVLRINNDD